MSAQDCYESMDECLTAAVGLVIRSTVARHYQDNRIRKNEVSRIRVKHWKNNLKGIRPCHIDGISRIL